MDNTTRMGQDSILKLIMQFSLPSIISMLVNAIYNIVDRFFVGNYVPENEFALGGLTVVFPLMMVLFAVGALFGIGGSTLISIKFGEQNKIEPDKIYGNMLSMIVIGSLLMIGIISSNLHSLLMLVGATEDNIPYAMQYMQIIMVGIIPQLLSFGLAAIARVEGRPRLAMVSQLAAALTNIVLDAVFIVGFEWGVPGAAWATVIGQVIGLLVLCNYFFIRKKSIVKLQRKNLILSWSIVKRICFIGLASFFLNIGNSLSSAFTNVALRKYGADAAITSMGAISSLFTLFLMPILGVQQGIIPIMGYNHGMKNHDRTWKTLCIAVGLSMAFATLFTLIIELSPDPFVALFISSESESFLMCVHGLRIQFALLPLMPICILGISYFQATARGGIALFLSCCRQVMVLPTVFLLPQLLGLDGVWLTSPLTDFIAVLIVFFTAFYTRRQQQLKPLQTLV